MVRGPLVKDIPLHDSVADNVDVQIHRVHAVQLLQQEDEKCLLFLLAHGLDSRSKVVKTCDDEWNPLTPTLCNGKSDQLLMRAHWAAAAQA
jgi:hypothetical protein